MSEIISEGLRFSELRCNVDLHCLHNWRYMGVAWRSYFEICMIPLLFSAAYTSRRSRFISFQQSFHTHGSHRTQPPIHKIVIITSLYVQVTIDAPKLLDTSTVGSRSSFRPHSNVLNCHPSPSLYPSAYSHTDQQCYKTTQISIPGLPHRFDVSARRNSSLAHSHPLSSALLTSLLSAQRRDCRC